MSFFTLSSYIYPGLDHNNITTKTILRPQIITALICRRLLLTVSQSLQLALRHKMGSGIKMDIFPHHRSIFHYFMKRLIAEEFFRENSQFLIE